ncbi:MAG: hypothetical protein DCC67_07750 [Planctomycetota bacterium]|nr:MAG: hypothetical protein DCC67_07750 [Planctomycetota bacterium]
MPLIKSPHLAPRGRPADSAMPRPSDFTLRLYRVLDQVGPTLAMVAVWILFAVLGRDSSFATWANTQTILLQTAVIGIAALGMTMIIISGGIDLSAGSMIARPRASASPGYAAW